MRGVDGWRGPEISRAVERALSLVDGVRWAQVNEVLGRVVVDFDPDEAVLSTLVAVVEAVEEDLEVSRETFPHERPEHPGDIEPIRRNAVALGADAIALGAVVFGQVLQWTPFPTELASIVSLVENEPRLRHALEHRVGLHAADLGLGVTNAFAQAIAQGPAGLAVDMTNRLNALTESQARRRSWQRNESRLSSTPTGPRDLLPALPARPRSAPLHDGPLERYTDRAALASLCAFGASLPFTRSVRRSAALLVAGLPKAARHGREAFAAHLGRELASRDVVVMDATVLRRLDRVDTLVIDAELVRSSHHELGRCVALDGAAVGATRARAELVKLYGSAGPKPRGVRRSGAWSCGPLAELQRLGHRVPAAAAPAGRAVVDGHPGAKVVALSHRDVVVAVAALEPVVDPMATALVAAARRSGLRVVLAGGGADLRRVLDGPGSSPGARPPRSGGTGLTSAPPDGVPAQRGAPTPERDAKGGRQACGVEGTPGGTRLATSVRALQRAGAGVMLVSASNATGALEAADCGVGIVGQGAQPPWGADLLTGPGLRQACLVAEASGVARAVSSRSALIASVGSAIGGAWAMAGPAAGAGSRAALPMNLAALVAQANGVMNATSVARRPAPVARVEVPWHAMEGAEVLDALQTSTDGLTPAEAQRRHVGRRREPPMVRKAAQAVAAELANPLTPLLAGGAALSAAVGSISDAGLVAGVTAANAVIGAAQRLRAEVSIGRLAQASVTIVDVVRSGASVPLERAELVPGDIVSLEAGTVVPADCRVLWATGCEVDESALTGESLPVTKRSAPTPGMEVADRRCMLYDGTTVSSGAALAVVVATGDDTEVGRSLADAPEPPPSGVEARLRTLTDLTVPVTVASGGAVTAMGLLRGRSPRLAVSSGVGLTVAAVPEGLPLLATMAQQSAARRLAARGALVRNPRTIEALGRVDTLCFDKTGTLTQGEIELQCVSDGVYTDPIRSLGDTARGVLESALRATPVAGDDGELVHATDRAVVAGGARAGVSPGGRPGAWRPLAELAFDPARGLHAVLGEGEDGPRMTVKGAPEVVLPRCTTWRCPDSNTGPVPLDRRARRRVEAEVELLASAGLRVLAVAERPAGGGAQVAEGDVRDMELLGFVALADSVRPTAARAVASLREAGVDVVMITGDHPGTAGAIAKELGILNGHRILTGSELDDMDDDELRQVVTDVSVFARVTPTHKVRIVRAYQRAGKVVAMTGDGANDAPAIRLAHTGIALGSRGSPAAREAADLVVVDDRMETILDAIAEGRGMWMSVREALAILVGGNLGEVAFSLATAAMTGASSLAARQFLLVNLLTDMVPAAVIAVRPPRRTTAGVLLREGPDRSLGGPLVRQIAARAATTAAGATGAWALARVTGRRRRASTVGLAALVGTQLAQTALVGRTSPVVLVSTAVSAAALVAIVQTPGISQFFGCTPLGPLGWGIAVGSTAAAMGATAGVPVLVDALRLNPSRDELDAPRVGGTTTAR